MVCVMTTQRLLTRTVSVLRLNIPCKSPAARVSRCSSRSIRVEIPRAVPARSGRRKAKGLGRHGPTPREVQSRHKVHDSVVAFHAQVYYSSSAQIGRLIENLSQGMDAGSFNFSMPNSPAGRSNPSSYHSSENGMHWTIEETLDHMLKSVARPV